MHAVRSAFLDFVGDPFLHDHAECVRFIPDGLLVIEGDKIKDFGPYADLRSKYAHLSVVTYADRLIVPGLIDCHVHYPQSRMIASFGNQLLEWLDAFVWPEEIKFRDAHYARSVASFFLDQMLRAGTTTVQSYTTTFPDSVDVFFEEASKRNMRVIAGLTGIDEAAPAGYRDTAESFYEGSKALYQKWHGKGRNLYAVTLRWALGSTDEQLRRTGNLYQELPDVSFNSHLSENLEETQLLKKRFPWARDYLDVFERFGLLGPRCNFGHAIHLSNSEFERLAQSSSSIAFCPSSELFLGSGLFKIATAKENGVRVGLGSDIGAGNFFCLLRVLNDAYKVGMLQGYRLGPFEGLFLTTRGGAEALHLADKIGSFAVGNEADFAVLDPLATPELAQRNLNTGFGSLEEVAFKLFGIMMLGHAGVVDATYVAGKRVHTKKI
jgi:guanine deaminase